MARLPIRRRPTQDDAATLLAAVAPLVPDVARSRHIRRAVGVTRNVSTIVTTVPFVPLPARVAAGALTGVATAVDAALRPMGERAPVPTAPQPNDDEILHDPALFAADAASALAAGALAAGQAIARGSRSPLLRRSVTVVAVTGIVVTVGALGYRFVVGPALARRRQRRQDAMALIVLPDAVLQAPAATPAGADDDAAPAGDAATQARIADADAMPGEMPDATQPDAPRPGDEVPPSGDDAQTTPTAPASES
jgi:hypothetical protein